MLARNFSCRIVNSVRTVNFVTKVPNSEIPTNTNTQKTKYSEAERNSNGIVYDKNPVKVRLEAGETYYWCLCGYSKFQPMCDGIHKDKSLNIPQRAIKFQVEKTKDYWLCNCKHTKKRPFCDGAHKQKEVQNATIAKL